MARKKTPTPVVHIVQRVAWTEAGHLICCHCDGGKSEGWPIRAFTDPGAAERFRSQHELQARQESNPFDYGEDLRDLSEYGDELRGQLCAALEAMGIPDAWGWDDIVDWQVWWRPEELSEEQEAAIWDQLDAVRFYDTHVADLEEGPASRARKENGLFVVHGVNWVESHDGPTQSWMCMREPSPEGLFAGRPVRAFRQRDAAEAFQVAQEAEVRAGRNPFACGDFDEVTSAEEPLFHDYLLDLGVDPPPPDDRDRRKWWAWCERTAPGLTAEQRERLWQQLDRVRFFQVVEVPWE